MNTAKLLMTGVLLFCPFAAFSQDKIVEGKDDEIRVKKQLLIVDLENQIKDIPYAAVRVYARCMIASWLWKDGKDDTGRAEEIAAAAIHDHYKYKNEIPFPYFFDSRLFNLIDSRSKDLAKQLKEKYKASLDESALITDLLSQKNGEKLAVDAAVRMLSRPNEQNPDFVYLLMTLDQRGSSELSRLLGAILAADQTGRIKLPTNMIEILTGFLIKPDAPNELRKQFIKLVLTRARNVAALSEPDQWAYYRTMQRLWPDISTRYPEMLAEAGTIHVLLSARVDRATREGNERYERLQNSPDKLAATVAEAERADKDLDKHILFKSAANLALKEKKFVYAVDLMEKASEIDVTTTGTSAEFSKRLHDQFYREVVTKALESSEPDAANHAVKKMGALWSKAEGLRRISKFYIDKNDLDSGRHAHDEALKLIGKTETSQELLATVVRMLPSAQKIDSSHVFELSQVIAKKINTIPSLNVEDKPETRNYQDYVIKAMTVNWFLLPALTELVKVDKNAAADLAGRIEKKEIKLIADFVLSTNAIDSLPKLKKATESAISPSQ